MVVEAPLVSKVEIALYTEVREQAIFLKNIPHLAFAWRQASDIDTAYVDASPAGLQS